MNREPINRGLGVLGALILLAGAGVGAESDLPPVVLPGESRATARRLDEARTRVREKKWPEALEELQAVLDKSDDLVPVDGGRSVHAHRLCHALIARMPPEALRLYRNRADPQARKWLEQARAGRDVALLRKVVEEAFCSRPAEGALDLLGDLAFERGRYQEARAWWGMLVPLTPPGKGDEGPARLVYPDPQTDAARVRAKQLLAGLFQARTRGLEVPESWQREFDGFAARHGKAEGTLAGRKGRYVTILDSLSGSQLVPGDPSWATFGGDPQRGLVVPAPRRVLARLSALTREATYRYSLAARTRLRHEPPPPLRAVPVSRRARTFAFHPVVTENHVIVADARYVTAYDLRSGRSEDWYDAGAVFGGANPNLQLPAPEDLRYTLTVAEGCVFARLGVQDIRLDHKAGQGQSVLVCLGLEPGAGGKRLRWYKRPRVKDTENGIYEGAPVVHAGRVYAAVTRFDGERCVTAVECYPAHPEDTSPPTLWRRDLCETRELRSGQKRYRHHLLTLAGSQLVYCSHSGAVVAFDAITGRRTWAVRYRRSLPNREEGEPLHDLSPCLFAGGRLYVAPSDSDLLLCLDPGTGRTVWERERLHPVHLLGVGRDRLIFTTRHGLRAVGAADGASAGGWLIEERATRASAAWRAPLGRGLLVGDLVLWPTANVGKEARGPSVFAVRQEDGEPPADPSLLHRLPAGNLAYAHGCLAVADHQTLWVFVPPAWRLAERRKQARAEPGSRPVLLQLARAQADAGQVEEALETLGRAGESREVRAERHTILLEAAERAAEGKRWEEAAGLLGRAAERSFGARLRAQALVRAARLWEQAGQGRRAARVWRTIRGDEGLRGVVGVVGEEKGGKGRADGGRVEQSAAPSERDLPWVRDWEVTLEREEYVLAVASELSARGQAVWFSAVGRIFNPSVPPGRIENPSHREEDGLKIRPTGAKLRCRAPDTGKVVWETRLGFGPTWLAHDDNRVVVGGDGGVAGLRREDGGRVWELPASAVAAHFYRPAPGLSVALQQPHAAEPLGDFRMAGGRVFFLAGGHLFALDAATGRVAWHRAAPGAGLGLPFPGGRFFPHYHAGRDTLLAQSAGRRWLLDAASGRVVHETDAPYEPWPRAPLVLDDHTVCLVADARRVLVLDLSSGRQRWTYTLPGVTTQSGEPPSVLASGGTLLVVAPTNLGYQLQRLDRDSGRVVWDRPPLLRLDEVDTRDWAIDRVAVYFAGEGGLEARSLATGKRLWAESPAGGAGGWRVRRAGGLLLATPSRTPGVRFQFRWLGSSVQWKERLPPSGTPGFPLLCCDPETGQPIQRLTFPVGPLRLRVTLRPDLDLTPLPRVWAGREMTHRACPDVQVMEKGAVVAVGRRVWRLRARTEESR